MDQPVSVATVRPWIGGEEPPFVRIHKVTKKFGLGRGAELAGKSGLVRCREEDRTREAGVGVEEQQLPNHRHVIRVAR